MADQRRYIIERTAPRASSSRPSRRCSTRTTDFVALPLYDGELGVAPGHAPMIGRWATASCASATSRASTSGFYVDGGFVQVADNVVSVLTNRAIPAGRLDQGAIREAVVHAASVKAAGEDQMARRDRLMQQARAQLRVATRA